MKISKEQIDKLSLDIQEAARRDLDIEGVLEDSAKLSFGNIRQCRDFVAIATMTIQVEIALKPDVIEPTDPCKVVTIEELLQ